MKRRSVILRRLMHRRTELARRKARPVASHNGGRCGQRPLPSREHVTSRGILGSIAALAFGRSLTKGGA